MKLFELSINMIEEGEAEEEIMIGTAEGADMEEVKEVAIRKAVESVTEEGEAVNMEDWNIGEWKEEHMYRQSCVITDDCLEIRVNVNEI